MSEYELLGVDPQRKAHPAIKGGKEEHKDVPGSLGVGKVDGQRLFLGPGSAGMGGTKRSMSGGGNTVNRTALSTFKVRKRTLKG